MEAYGKECLLTSPTYPQYLTVIKIEDYRLKHLIALGKKAVQDFTFCPYSALQ